MFLAYLKTFLPWLMFKVTGKARYQPTFTWNKKSWSYNVFRFYEVLFWRRHGIRKEMSASYDSETQVAIYQFHSFESICVYYEAQIRKAIPKLKPVRVWVPVFASPNGLPMPASPYLFAIAQDTDAANSGGASGSFAYTVTGSDPMIFVHTNGDQSSDYAGQTVTYNSITVVAMVGVDTNASAQYGEGIFGLEGCATGENTLAYNSGDVDSVRLMVSSYSGCAQSSQPDSVGSDVKVSGNSTGETVSTTVVASNCWVVFGVYNNGGSISVSAGATLLNVPPARTDGWWGDSNGTVSTGANAASWTWNSSSNWGVTAVSFDPPVVSLANFKSWNSLAKASNKSIDDLAIASITKVNGVA